ncbi:HypC/HybG/HupF family hydrogenase formation chaperone [Patescibacteria group bacterium]
MCLAIPGKIKEIKGKKVVMEYPGQVREAFLGEENVKVGDYVLVQMGVASRVISKEDALEMQKAWGITS